MQQSIIRPNPPYPYDDLVLRLFCKVIKKVCTSINSQASDGLAKGMKEKIKHLKKMRDEEIITEEQYSKAIEMLLADYIKSDSESYGKNILNRHKPHLM